MKVWLRERERDPAVAEAITRAQTAIPDLQGRMRAAATAPPPVSHWLTDRDLWLRMLFSALVDADFLDTERHFRPDRETARGADTDIGTLWDAFERSQGDLMAGTPDTWMNRLRREVYTAALGHANEPAGFFRITGPTGIGKTRLSLGFALRHAQAHGLQRVIDAIPYTSITEQTAEEFRGIFVDHPRAVLEHHSAINPQEPSDTPTPNELWRRLAAENGTRRSS